MASDDARYAVYYAPEEDSPLGLFGQEWLSPAERHPPEWASDAELWSQATASAAHYGFHATLKAPFRLSGGRTETELLSAVNSLARDSTPFEAPALELSELGRYLALTFAAPCPDMDALHQRCVVELDGFRAPLTDADRQRRISSGLTQQQSEMLERYGYPYVINDFEFHLTLAGPLDDGPRKQIKNLLSDSPGIRSYSKLYIGNICVFFQSDRKTAFRLLERFQFVR